MNGWIASACNENGKLVLDDGISFKDESFSVLFNEAVSKVKQLTRVDADSQLQYGGLESNGAIEMLQKATKEPINNVWDVPKVIELYASCNWNFPVNHSSLDEYWSARLFLEICASNGFSIMFEIME